MVVKTTRQTELLAKKLDDWRALHKNSATITKLFTSDRQLFLKLARSHFGRQEAIAYPVLYETSKLARRTWQLRGTRRKHKADKIEQTQRIATSTAVYGAWMNRLKAESEVPEISDAYSEVMSRLRNHTSSKAQLVRDLKLTSDEVGNVLDALKSRRLVRMRDKKIRLKAHR